MPQMGKSGQLDALLAEERDSIAEAWETAQPGPPERELELEPE